MNTTMIVTLNAVLALVAAAAVYAIVYLAHRLPSSSPHSDHTWGTGGDPWVPSDPLPFRQLATHEHERAERRAA